MTPHLAFVDAAKRPAAALRGEPFIEEPRVVLFDERGNHDLGLHHHLSLSKDVDLFGGWTVTKGTAREGLGQGR
jgi:hypothetical protein